MRYLSKKEFLEVFDKTINDDTIIDVDIKSLNTNFELEMELKLIPRKEVQNVNHSDFGNEAAAVPEFSSPGLVEMMWLTGAL